MEEAVKAFHDMEPRSATPSEEPHILINGYNVLGFLF